jgi:hypothetical protein
MTMTTPSVTQKNKLDTQPESAVQPDGIKKVDLRKPQPTEDFDHMKPTMIVVYGVLVIFGIGTGLFLSKTLTPKTAASQTSAGAMIKTDKVVGSADAKTFKDSAIGTVQKGGLDGEGTHKLIREGGDSQTAYLVSSVVDLDTFVGKKVQVWGETMAAKKVSWLMDVGKVELLGE